MLKLFARRGVSAITGVMLGLALGSAGLALAGGFLTNGYPTITATSTQANGATSPVTATAPNGIYTQLAVTTPLIPVDTNLAGGQSPQSVAASPFQIAAWALEAAANTATSTAGAATLNTKAGLITTEALTTAAGSTYTFTLTNSLVTVASAAPQVQIMSKSNTAVTSLQLVSATNAAGSVVWVFKNVGANALNGTMLIAFHV
jgi:hypothetical protein